LLYFFGGIVKDTHNPGNATLTAIGKPVCLEGQICPQLLILFKLQVIVIASSVAGDLNGNGISADAGDLVLMKRASIGEIQADSRYDLNNNGINADAGDLVLMKRASIGEIILYGPPTIANWNAWHEYISHQPTPGTGCFEANYSNSVWQRTTCAPAPLSGHAAPSHTLTTASAGSATVGNTNDYVAQSTGTLIGSALGTFLSVSGLTSENDVCVGPAPFCTSGGAGANAYALQVNTQSGFPVTFNGNPTTGWEQFVFDNSPSGSKVWTEFWLFGYSTQYLKGGSCSAALPVPAGASGNWYGPEPKDLNGYTPGDCYFNTNGKVTPFESPTTLSSLSLEGIANIGGNDEANLCVSGGNCFVDSSPASFLNLSQQWTLAEFNVVGFIDGSRAQFNSGTTITVQNDLKDSSGNAITPVSPCPNNGQTGETNNLNLVGCTASSSGITFLESTFVEYPEPVINQPKSGDNIVAGVPYLLMGRDNTHYIPEEPLFFSPFPCNKMQFYSNQGIPTNPTSTQSPDYSTIGICQALMTFNTPGPATISLTDTNIYGVQGTTSVYINIIPPTTPFDFSIVPSFPNLIVTSTGNDLVTVNFISGSPQPVALSVSGNPSGTTCGISPATVTPGQQATLTCSVNTPMDFTGFFPLTISGSGGGVTHSATVTLVVEVIK
jgi:hypothetical protein